MTGTVTVTANATDDVGVVGVQFLLDGVDLAAEDTTAPYSVSWATTTATNGAHTLTARARDAAGNATTSSPVGVTVSNTEPPPAGIVAGYAFDDGPGTSAADASGHGITGTLTNGADVGPPGGTAARSTSTAVDDYVDLGNPTALRLTGSMTVSAWINSAAFPGDDAAVVSKRGSIGFQLDTTIDRGPRTIGFKLTGSSGADMIRYGATAMQTNTWYHVAGVYNATTATMTVYLNGQVDDGALLGTVTASQQNSPENVHIGRRANGGFLFNGRIDDVRIYDRALTAAEIQTDMTTASGSAVGRPDAADGVDHRARQPVRRSPTSSTSRPTRRTTSASRACSSSSTASRPGAEDTTAPVRARLGHAHRAERRAHADGAGARRGRQHHDCRAGVAVNVANTNFFQNEILATGFNLPTDIEFLPDGRMLVVELAGHDQGPAAAVHARRTRRRSCSSRTSARPACSRGSTTSRSIPTSRPITTTTSSTRSGSPNRDRLSRFTANATLTGTVAGQRVRPLPGSAGCECRAPRRRDHLRQRRQALLHDRRALQRRRRAGR